MPKKDLINGDDEYLLRTELLAVLQEHPMMIFAIKNKYLDEHSWDIALEKDPTIFRFYRDPDYNECLKAVLLDGNNIQYVPYRNLSYEVCVTAIRNKPKAILMIPREKLDIRLMQAAIDLDGTLLKEYEDDVDGFYLEDKISENPSLILYLNHPDSELVSIAINQNPGLMYTIPKEWWTDEVKNSVREAHPDWGSYIPNV